MRTDIHDVARRILTAMICAVIFLLARTLLVAIMTAWNRRQFSLRPELENWTFPDYGTELPSTIIAALIAAAVFGALELWHGRRASGRASMRK